MEKQQFQQLIQRSSQLQIASDEKCADQNCGDCTDAQTHPRKTASKQDLPHEKSR